MNDKFIELNDEQLEFIDGKGFFGKVADYTGAASFGAGVGLAICGGACALAGGAIGIAYEKFS